ncbi:MAG: hypothetical protein CVT80_03540 [Alphaproteobacteria bacterium HGW-Alphaproteobacteria-2]|nr:MAG: hypothetical protein CVT80_03540 [Alphaproteobacteria bacterium HGW-Alphaproteobacteria-2]
MTLLSICIPTFNRAGSVLALVEALHRVPGDFEICIHDDGSSDDTYARLTEIGDPRLRLSRSANGGRALALRAAIGRASGHFAMIHDDDDMLHPEARRRWCCGRFCLPRWTCPAGLAECLPRFTGHGWPAVMTSCAGTSPSAARAIWPAACRIVSPC